MPKAFSLKVYPELEMFAPFSPEGIREYPQGHGIRENALACTDDGTQSVRDGFDTRDELLL